VNENQYSTAMLASLTANINRAEGIEPLKHNMFLRYPSADEDLVHGMCPEAIAIFLSLVPTTKMAEIMLAVRDVLTATYIWESDRWMYR
jgi:hypothetical protein